MDEFGVLTEQYGLKPQGKSAPMSASKRNAATTSSSSSSSVPNPSWDFSVAGIGKPDSHASAFDDSSVFVQTTSSSRSGYGDSSQRFVNLDDFGDVFGGGGMYKSSGKSSINRRNDGGFDYDNLFDSGSRHSSGFGVNDGIGDDIFGGFSGLSGHKGNVASVDDEDIFDGFKSNPSVMKNDVLGSLFIPPPRSNSKVGDLLGGFESSKSLGFTSSCDPGSAKMGGNNMGLGDDLIPGFGGSNGSSAGRGSEKQSRQLDSEDPFVILESTSKPVHTSADPLEEFDQLTEFKSAKHDIPKANSPKVSSIDELEEFVKGKAQKNVSGPDIFGGKKAMSGAKSVANKQGAAAMSSNKEKAGEDLESFYTKSRASSAPKSRPQNMMNGQDIPKMPQKPTVSASMKKASSATNMFDDLSAMFGAGPSEDFEEIEGETEERRTARLRRHGRTQERVGITIHQSSVDGYVDAHSGPTALARTIQPIPLFEAEAQAVAEMNQRDYKSQQEQDKRYKIAENIDLEIKQWVAGKEGNIRALLSSLQNVLWHESGWETVSLTDLITSTSVKKVYRKAALCVHPDKVQQKGATVEQKYVAEKVFDILQEAWKKLETEELK